MLDYIHYILLGCCIFLMVVIFLMAKYKSFKQLVRGFVIQAEKEFAGEKGKDKFDFVLGLVKKSS